MSSKRALDALRSQTSKIVCVARNYRAHAAELNNPVPTAPVFFMKATSSLVHPGQPIKIPRGCAQLGYEVELAVQIGSAVSKVSVDDALQHVAAYALALDMTARDWQESAKKSGLPWFLAKSFDGACPLSESIELSQLPVSDLNNVPIWLSVNGQIKQNGNTEDMVFDVATLISTLSQSVSLLPGDWLLTGTPDGVGLVSEGDVIRCGLGAAPDSNTPLLADMTFNVIKSD